MESCSSDESSKINAKKNIKIKKIEDATSKADLLKIIERKEETYLQNQSISDLFPEEINELEDVENFALVKAREPEIEVPNENKIEMDIELIRLTQEKIMNSQEEIKKDIEMLFKEIQGLRESNNLVAENGLPPLALCRNGENNEEEIHVGRNIWIEKTKFDGADRSALNKFTRFVRNMSIAIFGIDTLMNSSISGHIGPRCASNTESPRPQLDPTKLLAIRDISRWWLVNVVKNEKDVANQLKKISYIISHQISDLRTPDDVKRERKNKLKLRQKALKRSRQQNSDIENSEKSSNGLSHSENEENIDAVQEKDPLA